MKLISMTEFVNQTLETGDAVPQIKKLGRYADFLKQALTLGMFVPVGEDGNVLSEPKWSAPDGVKWDDYVNKWNKAKERVLFEGFENTNHSCNESIFKFIRTEKEYIFCSDTDISEEFVLNPKFKTVEDLINTELTLTQSAIKQLGL